jgi:hypothetical protein
LILKFFVWLVGRNVYQQLYKLAVSKLIKPILYT